jgi:hypothetical protein
VKRRALAMWGAIQRGGSLTMMEVICTRSMTVRRGVRERAPEKEREPERHWDEGDRRRGDKRRYQEYSEDNDNDRRVRARARSQSRNDGYDDHPRRWR